MDKLTRFSGLKEFFGKFPAWGWMMVIVLLGIAWKAVWRVDGAFPFNADEAITGLMARHIVQGERPVFFYGQAYMGSLDAFLAAGLFRILGDTSLAIRILQIMLYTCTIITTACLGKKLMLTWEAGLIAALLMAIPVVNVTLYTTVSLGGYGEALVLSNCAFLCAMQIQSQTKDAEGSLRKDMVIISLLGLITGMGFWVFGLTLVATVPAVVFSIVSIWQRRNRAGWLFPVGLLLLAVCFLLGSYPWWQASLSSGLSKSIGELFGSAVSIEKENWFLRTGMHLFYYVFLGLPAVFGFRPPWEVRWLVLPLLPIILMGWVLAFWRFWPLFRKASPINQKNWGLLICSVGLLTAGFLFTSFGLDPSGRYFLPLAVPFSLLMGWVITTTPLRKVFQYLLVGVLLSYNILGTVQAARKNPPGITTQFDEVSWIDHRYDGELMEFLRIKGELRGYSNYWVAYPLAFQSNEEILFSPRLPYHVDLRYTSRDDRIPEYTRLVDNASKTAYITTFNLPLDRALESGFSRLGVSWQEKTIGDYHVFYELTRLVHPAELETELKPTITVSGE
jgi:4-amino-4-deoxy-L-arabinose transferase-like glycosyltransferase